MSTAGTHFGRTGPHQRLKSASYKLQNTYSCHFQFRQAPKLTHKHIIHWYMTSLFLACIYIKFAYAYAFHKFNDLFSVTGYTFELSEECVR